MEISMRAKSMMEESIVDALELLLSSSSSSSSSSSTPPLGHHHCHLLCSARSVILNPSSPSDSTIRRILNALSLHLTTAAATTTNTENLHQTLHFLTDIALLHRHLSPLALAALRSSLHRPPPRSDRLAADAISAIATITGAPLPEADGQALLSLLSSPIATVRLRAVNLLRSDAVAAAIGDGLRVFLRLMKDPCPLVKRAALDGFVDLVGKNDGGDWELMERCYDRAVELLLDRDEVVRIGAIGAVSEWGQILADAKSDADSRKRLDEIFVQLCCMVRDMDKGVRIKAFHALGKTRLVSETILLQTLSKKILGVRTEKSILGKCIAKETAFSLSGAAGAYVHGLEDEFHEVRKATCNSLGSLTTFSIQFADDALNLLMDIINDDTSMVRLQTLNTMFQMAVHDHLKVHEKYMHMFLSVLADVDSSIRRATRNLLRVMKLPDHEIFRSSIDGLITNLETYPEDESDIFSVLFYIGKSHGGFVVSFLKETAQEIKPSCEGELGLDRPRIVALLVLAIAAPFAGERIIRDIPSQIFSYAVLFLGRISCSLEDVIHRDVLLAYLCQCASQKMKDAEFLLHGIEGSSLICSMKKGSLQQVNDGTLEVLQNNLLDFKKVFVPIEEYHQNVALEHGEFIHVIKLILSAAADTWPLIKSRCTEEVLRTLRVCKRELEILPVHSHGSAGVLPFALHYLKLIKLLMRVWEHLQPRNLHISGTRILDILLEKLDISLRSMRYGFLGLSTEEECYVLELVLLSCVLRLSKVRICCGPTLSKLHATLSRLDALCGEESIELSDFAKELKKCCQGEINETPCPLPVNKLVEIFSLKQIVFSGGFKHIKAEIYVPDNDSENPLLFIPGLPVGITFQITLYNISLKDRVWLRMVMEGSFQHVFLDLNRFEGSDKVKKCTIEVPFYSTPKAPSFSLRSCVGIECQLEDVIQLRKGHVGPKHDLMFLGKEKVIYLAIIDSNG